MVALTSALKLHEWPQPYLIVNTTELLENSMVYVCTHVNWCHILPIGFCDLVSLGLVPLVEGWGETREKQFQSVNKSKVVYKAWGK